MEQNNIENQIREKLNSREIKPTEMAWDRLDAMLTVAEEKKSKKGFSWLFIAACFLGMLTLGTIIYQLNSNEIAIDNEVVNQNNNNNNNNSNNKIQNSKVIQEDENQEIEHPIEKIQQIIQSNNNTKLATRNSLPEINNSIINQKTTEKIVKEISLQTDQVIVQVENPITENKEIATTNKQIDVSAETLLASVDKARKSVKQTKVSVNASSLLSQVDGEINKDYRETNFQKLKRNFETVKVAVANRNNQ
ncbi:hypothetical protein [Flavobacterium sp.]|uniref:hypothetical protein n=1 Tax=Flavobacterium sp. TaxID=239 RepID=UPI00375167FC